MKIVVPIKQVGQLLEGFEVLDASRVDPDFIDYEINESDTVSLAAAAVVAAAADAEVVAVAVGDDSADAVLRQAIALGANRAVRVDPTGLGDPDVLQVARLLADVVQGEEEATLVLCGVQSSDAGAGATSSALAGYLGWPRVASVVEIEALADESSVRRELAGGIVERLAVSLPAVLAMQSGHYDVPYPTMMAKMAAKRATIEVLTVEQLNTLANVELVRGSIALGLAVKESNGSAVPLSGGPADVAAAIRKIVEEALV